MMQLQGFTHNQSEVQKFLWEDVQQGLTDKKAPSQMKSSCNLCSCPGLGLGKFANHLRAKRRRHKRKMNNLPQFGPLW